MIIKVTMWKGNTDGIPVNETHLIYKGSWTFEGEPPELTPRVVWFMNQIHELTREFKRRGKEAEYRKELKNDKS